MRELATQEPMRAHQRVVLSSQTRDILEEIAAELMFERRQGPESIRWVNALEGVLREWDANERARPDKA